MPDAGLRIRPAEPRDVRVLIELFGERLEWAALDWNELALGFYRRLGARTMGEWITHRLDGDALSAVAEDRR